jgi:DNA-binding NarL/FixJ family response regulator
MGVAPAAYWSLTGRLDPETIARMTNVASEKSIQTVQPRLLLLIEDEADARNVLSHRLQAFGWKCLMHPNGEEGLRDPDLKNVDAIVADVVLGEGHLSGIEMIAALRKQNVRVPVVLVTAFADQPRLKAALNAGAAYLLEKPFTTDALRQVLDRVTRVDVDLAKLVDRALSKVQLTPKEDGVARLVLKGLASAEIAAIMGNSEKTIKQHLTQIYAKLGVDGRAAFFHFVFPS